MSLNSTLVKEVPCTLTNANASAVVEYRVWASPRPRTIRLYDILSCDAVAGLMIALSCTNIAIQNAEDSLNKWVKTYA
jgi:hypothetical protein